MTPLYQCYTELPLTLVRLCSRTHLILSIGILVLPGCLALELDADGDGVSVEANDCNDSSALSHPSAPELCDGVDNNCDGQTDEPSLASPSWYEDKDEDGFGDASSVPTLSCSDPSGGVLYVQEADDCNDMDASAHPGGTPDTCSSRDLDCDGESDGDDLDSDGYYATCSESVGHPDCNDTDDAIYPGQSDVCNDLDDDCDQETDEGLPKRIYYEDLDQDGFGNGQVSVYDCARPPGYSEDGSDCNDQASGVHPDADEICNEVDDNCNASIDEGVQILFYLDSDQDTFGDPLEPTLACEAPSGYVADGSDCDDTRASVNVSATEVCNGLDDDCSGAMDDEDPHVINQSTYYLDADADAHGSSGDSIQACSLPTGYAVDNDDCVDGDALVYPGAPEQCNGDDDNCNGEIDENVQNRTYYEDIDGDGYGGINADTLQDCVLPSGYSENNKDCDDMAQDVHPHAEEVIDNQRDEDCDGGDLCYQDKDNDTYRPYDGSTIESQDLDCLDLYEAVSLDPAQDCNDTDAKIRPGVSELVADGIDQNCDQKEECFVDSDEDGYRVTNGPTATSNDSDCDDAGEALKTVPDGDCNDQSASIHPGATELCNTLDDNCDGGTDPACNRVFVTAASYSASLLIEADDLCASAASAAMLPGRFVAWVSTATTSAHSKLAASRGWLRMDGLPFADRVEDLVGGKIFYPLNLTESAAVMNGDVWTGTLETGEAGETCLSWTEPSSSVMGHLGRSYGTTFHWTQSGTKGCGASLHLYCFQTDYTTAVVLPPPMPSRRAFLSHNVFVSGKGVSEADLLCQSEAEYYGLSGAFSALISTDQSSALSRFDTAGLPWARPDGLLLAPTAAGLFSGTNAAETSLNQDLEGLFYGSTYAATGATTPNVTSTGESCSSWTSASDSLRLRAGRPAQTGAFGFNSTNSVFCNNSNLRLYCLEH